MFFKLPVIMRLVALGLPILLCRKAAPDETCLLTRLKTANLKQDDSDNDNAPGQQRETEN
jgi:hypothetical protein